MKLTKVIGILFFLGMLSILSAVPFMDGEKFELLTLNMEVINAAEVHFGSQNIHVSGFSGVASIHPGKNSFVL